MAGGVDVYVALPDTDVPTPEQSRFAQIPSDVLPRVVPHSSPDAFESGKAVVLQQRGFLLDHMQDEFPGGVVFHGCGVSILEAWPRTLHQILGPCLARMTAPTEPGCCEC